MFKTKQILTNFSVVECVNCTVVVDVVGVMDRFLRCFWGDCLGRTFFFVSSGT